jgi:glycosyltransferase involved in cell wall biosynthesis
MIHSLDSEEIVGAQRSVLFIVPSLGRAGAEKQIVDFVNGLSSEKFKKHLVCYRSDTDLSDIVETGTVKLYLEQRTKKLDYRLVKRLAYLVDLNNIDVIHCTLQNALLYGWLARLFAHRRGVRLIAALHTTLNVSWKHDFADRAVYQHLLRACASVWFVCNAQKDYWIGRYQFLKPKSRVVYNGVDSRVLDPSKYVQHAEGFRQAHNISTDATLISCIAGFRPEKGHAILVRAFKRIASEYPQARLVLAGDGPTRRMIEDQARDQGLTDKILFLGQIDDVVPLIAASSCTVLASTSVETFSIAMLESMSMAVPVVSTKIGGAGEAIVNGETGYLVSPGSENDLAQALMNVLSDPRHAERMGYHARQKVVDHFDTRSMICTGVRLLDERG